MDAEEHRRRLQWGAAGWIADHQLLGEEYWEDGRGARWLVGQPHTFIHRAEVIAGIGGSLVVHGDFDLCRFGHYGDHGDAWRRLLWMADCTDVGHYVAQKADIGMARGRRGAYDSDVAVYDLRREITDRKGDGDHEALVEVLTEAIHHTDHKEELHAFLYENDDGWDLLDHRFGSVTPGHVVTNHCLLQRTAVLLRAKYGAGGPIACRQPRVAE